MRMIDRRLEFLRGGRWDQRWGRWLGFSLSTSALSALRLRGFDALARAVRPSWTSPAERIRHRCRTRTFPDGPDSWLICASKSGAATYPGWFINLAKNP